MLDLDDPSASRGHTLILGFNTGRVADGNNRLDESGYALDLRRLRWTPSRRAVGSKSTYAGCQSNLDHTQNPVDAAHPFEVIAPATAGLRQIHRLILCTVVQPLRQELTDGDRRLLRSILAEKVTAEPDTFEILARWSRSRLKKKAEGSISAVVHITSDDVVL